MHCIDRGASRNVPSKISMVSPELTQITSFLILIANTSTRFEIGFNLLVQAVPSTKMIKILLKDYCTH